MPERTFASMMTIRRSQWDKSFEMFACPFFRHSIIVRIEVQDRAIIERKKQSTTHKCVLIYNDIGLEQSRAKGGDCVM